MKRRDFARLSTLSAGSIIIPSTISSLEKPSVAIERGKSAGNDAHLSEPQMQSDLIANAPFVYSIILGIGGLAGGTLHIDFYEYGKPDSNNAGFARFSAGFGGAVAGGVVSTGTAWFYYDVKMMAEKKWEARIQANLLLVGVNVNLWGMQGEVIGNTASGGIGVALGVVGGQGSFYL